MKTTYPVHFGFRISKDLSKRIKREARLQRLDESDIVRLALLRQFGMLTKPEGQ